ncbi:MULTISPECIES: NAD(P)/FAD-dependent oxidoreductase [Streptomyces]|uniref:FAD-dependent oxidoreductase n=1 Tax=Streptomyces koelreuteriae TaxID=2838015 RepID=A0ABX8FLS9_9ACTN|nr:MULTISPECIES: NAD(P)/FAD-dependent oxidoreductase [Streptomyces]QWB22061.1 FAD-dependent oxidoreductase [Streptomyces koelreuteriae]UUA04994.1 FAD-dependent oxidoreductase [Streptomyces koelreuteriae]UUA12618.1 FAD-dependent oxidoreductase [Streptomyces sp. CRCS-T-1]
MSRPRIVIVGAGFAGYRAARTLARQTRGRAHITLLNPTDYFLYLPLLPQVAAGVLEPRRVTVSLSDTLPHVRLVLGEADRIDLDGRTLHYTGPEGDGGTLAYDRLVLAAGSVNKLLPVPGVAEHAHGFRGLPEALYLRDHVTRQVELAAAADDPKSCAARCTFVVVGAGYTGTEVAAHGQMFTDAQVRKHPLRQGMRPRWILLDVASRVLPEMDARLSETADRVLRQRGVDVRTGTSVKEATRDGVVLSDGEFVETRTLVWCVGVRPDPLVESLGLPMEKGRLLVDPHLQVPGRPELFACGDVAAVPDLENPGSYTPMTAQHAWRHGKVAAENVAASLGLGGASTPYRHRDLGFVVDLGGAKAAANPLGVPLSGIPAGAVTRGYHLAAMPGNRVRVAADWLLDAVLPRQAVQLGLVRSWSVPLDTASPEVARVPGGPGRRREADARSGPGAAIQADTYDGGTGTGPGKGRAGNEPAKGQPGSGVTQVQPGSGAAERRSETELAKGRPSGERARTWPADKPAKGPLGDPRSRSGAGGEPAEGRAGGEWAEGRPGGERAEGQPGGERAEGQPGGEPARDQPGGEPAKNQPGGEPARSQPGGERAEEQPGREPARNQPGGEPAKNQPGGEPAKNQPGGEPAKNQPVPAPQPPDDQPPPGPGIAPGPVKRSDPPDDSAKGDS